ncbi:MAG: GIY-YIG nuclease family protein [Acidobacteria bacterium]|nr:GIY-YIG nuclease family protein [Acidobacteriota bacterium]
MAEQNAYLLFLDMGKPAAIEIGSLGVKAFPAGRYIYVGSARKGVDRRVGRHRHLAECKAGKLHWHIDYLLTHPDVRLAGSVTLKGACECDVARELLSFEGASAPVLRFGATDCRKGCKAHLYHLVSPLPHRRKSQRRKRNG